MNAYGPAACFSPCCSPAAQDRGQYTHPVERQRGARRLTTRGLYYTGAWNGRDPILQAIGGVSPTATITGYHRTDVNMDGVVKYTGANNDRDLILLNIGGVSPTAVRYSQGP